MTLGYRYNVQPGAVLPRAGSCVGPGSEEGSIKKVSKDPRWHILREIGEGESSMVWLAVDKLRG